MKTIFGILFGILLTVCSIKAANPVPYTFDVQGLILGNKYTNTQTRVKLGNNPLKMETWDDGEVVGREYRYGATINYNIFYFGGEQDEFSRFILVDSTYSIFEGHIKVGYNISKFGLLGGGLLMLKETDGNNNKSYEFYPIGNESEVFLTIKTDQYGKITSMWAELPV